MAATPLYGKHPSKIFLGTDRLIALEFDTNYGVLPSKIFSGSYRPMAFEFGTNYGILGPIKVIWK